MLTKDRVIRIRLTDGISPRVLRRDSHRRNSLTRARGARCGDVFGRRHYGAESGREREQHAALLRSQTICGQRDVSRPRADSVFRVLVKNTDSMGG